MTNDVGPSLLRRSPRRGCGVPPLPSSSSTVIILLGLLSLITCDFGVLCFCLPLVPPELVLIERADSGQYLPACRYLNEGGM